MKVCGIIAEYDPFHNGHAWQLKQAKEQTQADFLICVISCQFTQRGMPAYLCAHDRAEMALRCGADAVLGLPYAFSVCDAERFALGGVGVLSKTGVITHLSFGIEEEGLPVYLKAASLLESPNEAYTAHLRTVLNRGLAYPKAQGEALSRALNVSEEVFSLPNTSLAVCYARAALKLKAEIAFSPVIRRGSYHTAALPENCAQALPSATAVRAAIQSNNFSAVQSSMPGSAYEVLKKAIGEGRFHSPQALDDLLRWKIRTGSDFTHLPDLSEGIENRFASASKMCTREQMVKQIKTKRYPYARINRMLAHILTDTDASLLDPLPQYAYLLGFKKSAQSLIHALSHSELQLLTRLPAQTASYMQQLDSRAFDLWALGAKQNFGMLYRAMPVILP